MATFLIDIDDASAYPYTYTCPTPQTRLVLKTPNTMPNARNARPPDSKLTHVAD
jgi:hypothetical protein